MDEIKKETASEEQMNDEELAQVAGGMTIWWKRITGTWTDPATGRNYQDGYLVKGSELETGAKTDSHWVSINEWTTWKRRKEWQGHTFIEGDANPQAVK